MSDTGARARIGVLALQGDFDAHVQALARLGADTCPVRRPSQLNGLEGLVIPGGESTTLIKLLDAFDVWQALKEWVAAGHPVFGTCAGAILLAAEVCNPPQRSLDLIDITVERNSYGRQVDSFEARGPFRPGPGREREIEMVFIRAPRILRLGEKVTVLAECRGDPVMVRQEQVVVATFHPELSAGAEVHAYFVEMVRRRRDPSPGTT